jgi:hypothetical protein
MATTSGAGQVSIAPIRVALVYDFDGTLAPRNLPEHSFLPSVGVTDVEGFWEACRREAERHDSDQVLTYMRMLLTAAERAGTAVTRDLLRRHGAQTPLFAGVEAWFDDIGGYGRSVGVEIEHFVDTNLCDKLRNVRDDNHRALVLIKCFCNDRQVTEVDVVGRLVEDKQS